MVRKLVACIADRIKCSICGELEAWNLAQIELHQLFRGRNQSCDHKKHLKSFFLLRFLLFSHHQSICPVS